MGSGEDGIENRIGIENGIGGGNVGGEEGRQGILSAKKKTKKGKGKEKKEEREGISYGLVSVFVASLRKEEKGN